MKVDENPVIYESIEELVGMLIHRYGVSSILHFLRHVDNDFQNNVFSHLASGENIIRFFENMKWVIDEDAEVISKEDYREKIQLQKLLMHLNGRTVNGEMFTEKVLKRN